MLIAACNATIQFFTISVINPVLLLRDFRKTDRSHTLPDPGITPKTLCSPVALATTRPSRQSEIRYSRTCVDIKRQRHAFYPPRGRQRCSLQHVMPLYNQLLRNFRKTEKSPVILCPTRESNPRPHDWQSHLRPLDQRGRCVEMSMNFPETLFLVKARRKCGRIITPKLIMRMQIFANTETPVSLNRKHLHFATCLKESINHTYSHALYPQKSRSRCTLQHVMPLYNVQPLFTICVISPM
ncbi:hypothetical protein SFRURICE_021274 [Spodoptera frugiperda]|nr:hypothetical protein SFRURICE_021274 [Spodoptera frugiperda]